MPKALLIDDEDLAREDLRRLLAAHPEVSLVGEADSVSTARTRLAAPDYDLVFLDIDLAGGNSFDLVPHVSPVARIVFVTAHNEYAVRAFDVNALDYLLKPVSAPRLATCLARVAAAAAPAAIATSASAAPMEAPPSTGDTDRPFGTLAPGDRVFLKNDRGARFVPLTALAAIVSCDNYTDVFVADGSHFLVRRSLKAWESALPAEIFVRVHRQALINLSQLERIESADSETPTLVLRGVKQPVACSHRLTPDLRRRLTK